MGWINAAAVQDLEGREVLGLVCNGQEIALYRLEDAYYATQNICTHQHAHLSEGYVVEDCIECPLHQALFDIRTGKARGGVAKIDLKTYPVKVEGDRILVQLD